MARRSNARNHEPAPAAHAPSPARLPRRDRAAHKGEFGRILVVAGSAAMPGAAALCASAALRGGAGLVTLATTGRVLDRVASRVLGATNLELPADSGGGIAAAAAALLLERSASFDVCVLGPGLGSGAELAGWIPPLLESFAGPLVVDADGANFLARASAPPPRTGGFVLTPHPGEAGRLLGRPTGTTAEERREAAGAIARRFGAIAVLKGAGTVVHDAERSWTCATGNPGMATGGTGDVLAGLLGALLARRELAPFAAACLAVHVHGLAGDLAAMQLGEDALLAEDLLFFLPPALQEVAADGA